MMLNLFWFTDVIATLQVGVGFLAQYLIKPMLGYAIALVMLSIGMHNTVDSVVHNSLLVYY
jgi:hypothetical protein